MVNFKDRQKDLSVKITFRMTNTSQRVFGESFIVDAISLREVEKSLLNDTLIMKISVKQYRLLKMK